MLLRHINAAALQLRHAGGKGLGLFARRSIQRGDCLAFVNSSDIFSSANLYARSTHPYLPAIQDCLKGYANLKSARPSLFLEFELGLLMFFERRSELLGFASPWANYLDTLPASQPWITPAEVMSQFGASEEDPVVKQVDSYNRFVDAFAAALEKDLEAIVAVLKEQSAWAMQEDGNGDDEGLGLGLGLGLGELMRHELRMVGSRAWDLSRVEVAEGKKIALDCADVCIFPEIDMFNHASAPNAQIIIPLEPETTLGREKLRAFPFSEEIKASGSGVAVFASRDIKEGEEVHICYGRKEPKSMYARYGFVEEEESVPFMITSDLKQRLLDLGFETDKIRTLTPKEAWALVHPSTGVKTIDLDELTGIYVV